MSKESEYCISKLKISEIHYHMAEGMKMNSYKKSWLGKQINQVIHDSDDGII